MKERLNNHAEWALILKGNNRFKYKLVIEWANDEIRYNSCVKQFSCYDPSFDELLCDTAVFVFFRMSASYLLGVCFDR